MHYYRKIYYGSQRNDSCIIYVNGEEDVTTRDIIDNLKLSVWAVCFALLMLLFGFCIVSFRVMVKKDLFDMSENTNIRKVKDKFVELNFMEFDELEFKDMDPILIPEDDRPVESNFMESNNIEPNDIEPILISEDDKPVELDNPTQNTDIPWDHLYDVYMSDTQTNNVTKLMQQIEVMTDTLREIEVMIAILSNNTIDLNAKLRIEL